MDVCVYTHKYIYIKIKEELPVTVTVLSFTTGHVAVASIYKEERPLPFLYALCLQQAPQLAMVLCRLGD